MKKSMVKLKTFAVIFLFLALISCKKDGVLDDFSSNNKRSYQPLLDIYVVRGGSQDFKLPNGEGNATVFLKNKLFLDSTNGVNYGMLQSGIFYKQENIRVFYISDSGFPTNNYNNLMYHISYKTSFNEVDEGGTLTGNTITVDNTRQKLFFLKYSTENSIAGLSHVGYPRCFQQSYCKSTLTTLIFSSPFNENKHFYYNVKTLANTVIHELGHYFGLMHNFDKQGGISLSCFFEPQSTTLRYMDYYNNPQYFISCEQMIMALNAEALTGKKVKGTNPFTYDDSFVENIDFIINYLDKPHQIIWKNP